MIPFGRSASVRPRPWTNVLRVRARSQGAIGHEPADRASNSIRRHLGVAIAPWPPGEIQISQADRRTENSAIGPRLISYRDGRESVSSRNPYESSVYVSSIMFMALNRVGLAPRLLAAEGVFEFNVSVPLVLSGARVVGAIAGRANGCVGGATVGWLLMRTYRRRRAGQQRVPDGKRSARGCAWSGQGSSLDRSR